MGTKNTVFKGIAALAGACAGGTVYFFRRTMIRQNADPKRTIKMSGTDWSQYYELLGKRKEYMLGREHEDVYINSFDNLKLHATYFPADNESCGGKNGGPRRIVICFHGYTSKALSDFTGLTDYYFRHGFEMLHVDARAHGASEGKYIGFGCLDRYDAAAWIDWVIKNLGSDTLIYLHGISMGASTALMVSSMEIASKVSGIISDCAFTSPKEVFTHVLKTMYHLPAFPIIQCADILNRILAGYGMDECNAAREVMHSRAPILFIHGDRDTFVPTDMCRKMYACCRGEKQLLIVKGASHGESYYKNMSAYEAALDKFIEGCERQKNK